MKNKNYIFIIISLFLLIVTTLVLLITPIIYSNKCKNKFYEFIDIKLTDSTKNACVSFLWLSTTDGVKSYNQGNNGVIIDKKENKYYVLTANHILLANREFKVSFYSSPSFMEWKKDNVTSYSNYFETFPSVSIEYQNYDIDIAVISFESDDNYPVAKLAKDKVNMNDYVFSICNTNGEFFNTSYGEILDNNPVNYKFSDNISTPCLKHNCYITKGSSGSPVFNDSLELIGINIGGKTTLFNQFVHGYFVGIDVIQSVAKM